VNIFLPDYKKNLFEAGDDITTFKSLKKISLEQAVALEI
jgi:hypothetical protein